MKMIWKSGTTTLKDYSILENRWMKKENEPIKLDDDKYKNTMRKILIISAMFAIIGLVLIILGVFVNSALIIIGASLLVTFIIIICVVIATKKQTVKRLEKLRKMFQDIPQIFKEKKQIVHSSIYSKMMLLDDFEMRRNIIITAVEKAIMKVFSGFYRVDLGEIEILNFALEEYMFVSKDVPITVGIGFLKTKSHVVAVEFSVRVIKDEEQKYTKKIEELKNAIHNEVKYTVSSWESTS